MFDSVKTILEKSGISVYKLGNIVLTGGVTSIVGIDKLASEIFEKNVRIGYPSKLESVASEVLNPTHSCSLGMLVFLRNLHLKEKIKDGFESKNSWFARLIEKLVAV
jgi:cell division ATPase FtsA